MRIKTYIPLLILTMAPLFVLLTVFLSIRYGTKPLGWETIQTVFFDFNPDNVNHQIIIGSRLPRVIGAL
jgi:iron complex transport system permease protein